MIAKLNVHHSPSLYMQACVSFYTVVKTHNLKSTAFSEQTAKYKACQYFC